MPPTPSLPTLFWITVALWVLAMFASWYNASYRLFIAKAMGYLMDEAYTELLARGFVVEAHQVHDEIVPLFRDWFGKSLNFTMYVITGTLMLNVYVMFSTLLRTPTPFLNMLLALGTAGSFILLKEEYSRLWMVRIKTMYFYELLKSTENMEEQVQELEGRESQDNP